MTEHELTSDQQLFAETTRRFLADRADPDALRALRDDERGYDDTFWRQGAELGWTSLLVDEADGGGSISGAGVVDATIIAHEFGACAAPGPFITTNIVASALSRVGSTEQKAEVLAGLLSGEAIASWAHAEPRPNDALGTVATEATRKAGHWTLEGTKVQVESGKTAQRFLVTARTDDGLTQFLVPADAPGVSVEPMGTVDLSRRFAAVTFHGTTLTDSAVVGAVGGATEDVARQLQLANVLQSAEMVGALDTAMDITLEWVMDRYSFGRPLGSYQAIKHRLADMKTWLEASHALAEAAARAVQRGDSDADELCSGAKAYIGAQGPELCQECVQFHGGIGVTFEHDLHLYLRRVVVDATTHGTVSDHRLRLTDIQESRSTEGAA